MPATGPGIVTRPFVIGAVLDRVMMVVSTSDAAFTLTLPLADAERALGQLAVAILAAKAARTDGDWLDRRG